MKTALAAILVTGTLIGASLPASAQYLVQSPTFVRDDAYCLQGGKWGYPGNCQFPTFQACTAKASGIGGTCGENPRSYYSDPWW
jgi:hypothetical protein